MRVAARFSLVAAAAALATFAVLGVPAARAIESADMQAYLNTVWGVPVSAHPGGTITFTAEGYNAAPNTAVNAEIRIPVSHFLSARVTDYQGTTCSAMPTVDGSGDIVCGTASLAANHGMLVEVTLAVPLDATPGPSITSRAYVSSDTSDPNAGNDDAAAATNVETIGTLDADLSGGGADTTVAVPGETFTWNLQAYDYGPDAAVHVSC